LAFGKYRFYNSYLPEIAFPEQHDRVSAKGFMFGYAGSLILAFNLTMVMMPEWYGISDGSLPARISFLSVGIWWIGFAQLLLSFPNMFSQTRKTISSKDLESLEVY
jgi:UMF1 family MFS transporter